MTERESADLMLQMLGDVKAEQLRQRESLHDLRDSIQAERMVTALARKDMEAVTLRVAALEEQGQHVSTVQTRSKRAQAGYVSVGVVVLALVVKVAEVVGLEAWQALSKAVTR